MSFRVAVLLSLVVLGFGPPLRAADAEVPKIRLNGARVEVAGLGREDLVSLASLDKQAESWTALFAVYVVRDGGKRGDQPAMLGAYRVDGDILCFEPRFPLAPRVRYRVIFDPSRLPSRPAAGTMIEQVVSLPEVEAGPATYVVQVYPTADRVPENQLKFYLHFSAPMSRGEAYRRVHLLDERGKTVDLPFLELGEELWDPAGKRFTLLFDPGRIKRGVKPREEVGPPLREGQRYTFVIDQEWSDAAGRPLRESFRRAFRVTAAEDRRIDPKAWQTEAPAAGTREVFRVTFPRPLDHALLLRLLWIEDDQGRRVGGNIGVTDSETRWTFTPDQPWTTGAYRLVADSRLEDLAGNSIGQTFEVDLLREADKQGSSDLVKLPFAVR